MKHSGQLLVEYRDQRIEYRRVRHLLSFRQRVYCRREMLLARGALFLMKVTGR